VGVEVNRLSKFEMLNLLTVFGSMSCSHRAHSSVSESVALEHLCRVRGHHAMKTMACAVSEVTMVCAE
jgi:hypothetical protein